MSIPYDKTYTFFGQLLNYQNEVNDNRCMTDKKS